MKTLSSKLALLAVAAFGMVGCSTFDNMAGTNTASVFRTTNGSVLGNAQIASPADVARNSQLVSADGTIRASSADTRMEPVQIVQAAPPAAAAPATQMAPAPSHTYTATFGIGQSHIDRSADPVLNAAIADAKTKNGTIAVIGHADRSGDSASNMRLSEQRAKAVHDALVRAGISSSRIKHTAMGESSPLINTGDGVSESRNRRVEITVN